MCRLPRYINSKTKKKLYFLFFLKNIGKNYTKYEKQKKRQKHMKKNFVPAGTPSARLVRSLQVYRLLVFLFFGRSSQTAQTSNQKR